LRSLGRSRSVPLVGDEPPRSRPASGSVGRVTTLWRAGEHEPLTDTAWDPARAQQAIDAIVADALAARGNAGWPGHPLDDLRENESWCSIYLGAAGMIWGLWRLGATFDADGAIDAALRRYRSAPPEFEGRHPPSLWLGETGLLVVADRVGSAAANRRRLHELVLANREHPSWELMWGSPGTILAARACGLADAWRESAELLAARWDAETDMWPHELDGRWSPHLGPAHGFAGAAHTLRGVVSTEVLCARVARLLERTALSDDGLVNWPPQDAPGQDLAGKIRVQWCHGAPGIVATLGDLMPVDLALGGGELTWRAGPLAKGPGLCHGTAGNGHALLRLYGLTGDEQWLTRARGFGMHAVEQVQRQRATAGRGRYSLWTGDIGVALYLRACLQASAGVPSLDDL
jgi:hypothetical protein